MFKPRFYPAVPLMSGNAGSIAFALAFAAARASQASQGHRTGPGRVTVLTHHKYINDPRRKDWGRCRWGSRPSSKGA